MANRNTNYRVIITPPRPDLRFSTVIREFEKDIREAYKRLEDRSRDIIRAETPKVTGATANAWNSSRSVDGNLKATITLNNPNPQAQRLNIGTKPSRGRYVPELGRRITTGEHPGTKGTQYIQKATNQISDATLEEMKDVVDMIKQNTGKNFRFVGT